MSKPTPTFYILHGEDDLARDDAVKKMRSSMGDSVEADLNISDYDGESASVPEVLGAVRSFPFLSDKRLVIVKGMLSHLTRKGAGESAKTALERLLKELPDLPTYARLVFVERESLRADSKIVKLASTNENGYCKEFALPKDATQWIINRAKKEYESDIVPQAAMALASVTGNDLRRADNELFKLICYTESLRPITEADVALLTPYVAEANVFEMVDALATQNGKTALKLMHTALDQDPKDEGFKLLGLIIRQFRLLLLAREHLASGGNPKDLAQVLGIHPYPAEKVAKQSRAFTVEQLESIYRRLQKYDQDMKIGKIDPKLALDLFVASLSKK
jgi:DNA polymerase III subunit delta